MRGTLWSKFRRTSEKNLCSSLWFCLLDGKKISKREFNQIIESEETQKILNYFEGRFHVINNKNECDSSQITKLLKSIDHTVKNNGGQNYSNEIYLKNQRQLRETMKLEEEKKQEEKKGINTKEYVKTKESMETETEDITKKQEDMSKESREPTEHKHLRDKSAAVQEDHRKQMETRRERKKD
ncbi:DNA ligase 1-like [Ctenopharyngodon idella]|uniref:DNA ligase 1-like n=1 Tax=Ctenopharyngodon idella TaxID=7959 RepID=UPI0022304641|nr:DNA ligase 1-like [Ctenopharyngodon idella]